MILFTFLYHTLSIGASQIEKTIYLVEGEEYKVTLDGIFDEIYQNTYSFVSESKGFTLDTSSLKLKSDQGKYSQLPTKILRQRQLVNLEDYQGTGQFGILDEYDSGHRICYNSDTTIYLDQCIELDSTATNYDFVFIAKDTIAVSQVRVIDQQFGVKIYQNKEIISELYFVPSKTYAQVTQTIIEYCIFQNKQYLLLGVTEEDSNIEFLEIQPNSQIVNTGKVIDRSLLPANIPLQVYDIKGRLNKVYVACKSYYPVKQIVSFIFDQSWTSYDYLITLNFLALDLGYSFVSQTVAETYLSCDQNLYKIITKQGSQIFNKLIYIVEQDAKVRYTLNYLIILEKNLLIVSTFSSQAQRLNTVEGTILQIDVDFQNDILFVFTDTKILSYYLKQATLQFTSNTVTQNLDLVTIKAVAGENEQIANINFQVLSKDDYNSYLLNDLTKDLYCNSVFYSPKNSIPLNGISGADIKVEGKVDDYVEIIPKYLNEYGVSTYGPRDKNIILEQLLTYSSNPYLFRQYEDFSFSIYDCRLNADMYQCSYPIFTNSDLKQTVTVQCHQIGYTTPLYALMTQDGFQIQIYSGSSIQSVIQALPNNEFVYFKVGTDRLFVYTKSYNIFFYYFPSGDLISQTDLSQYGQPQGEEIKKLWVNQFKTNLIVMTYGEDLIIGRFTSKFIFIQRLTIKWVLDVIILADNKFTVLSTDKTNKKLTLYQLSDGEFKVQRELDTYGYLITGDNLLSGIVYGDIIVQAQKGEQKVLLAFQDTEMARNSLLKIIKLQDEEYAVNVIYNKQVSSLLKRSTNMQNNSIILNLDYAYQVVETNLTKIPNKFSQSLELQYSFRSSLSQNKVQLKKNLFLEYQFQNLTANQDPNNNISYYNREDKIKIYIKSDTFKGQVRTLQLSPNDNHFKLTTRFKNNKVLIGIPESSQCKLMVTFHRLICIKGKDVSYYDVNGNLLSQTNVQGLTTTDLKFIIIHNTDLYAFVQSTIGELALIYISENQIKRASNTQYRFIGTFEMKLFYKEWLVAYFDTLLIYDRFEPKDDLWVLTTIRQEQIYGILNVQYDPQTEQMFYTTTGYQNLYYYKCSLEGTTIDKQTEYSLNLVEFLKTQKIQQELTRVQNIQIISQNNQTYLFLSTYYGNILNMTIKSTTKEFAINNMYILNGPSSTVKEIQIIDDYVVVQSQDVQFLYKNTHDWLLDKPYLTLEEIAAQKFMTLFKNGSKIFHMYDDNQGKNIYQSNIDDEVFVTIQDLKSYTPGIFILNASNGYGQAQVEYQTIQLIEDESSRAWIWIVVSVSILAVLAIVGGGFFWFKKRRQSVDLLLA